MALTVYLSRKAEGKHSSNLFVGKLMECFKHMGVKYTHKPNERWDVALALINADDQSIFDRGPVVQRLDGIYFNTDDKSMQSNAGIQRTYQRSTGVIFQSSLAKNIVSTNFGSPKGNSRVIVNGTFIDDKIDAAERVKKVAPKIYSNISRFEKRLICVGKWRQIKRLSSVVYGSLDYIKEHPETGLFIVGPMSDEEQLKYRKLSKNIICLGHVPNDTVRHLQMLSHCCLNLSFTDSCPSAVIEALANGTPCVVTKHQGVTDVMKANEDGIIIDYDKWDYRPVSYNGKVVQIPPAIVASAIDKCIRIGRRPFRYDLEMSQTAKKYVEFLQECSNQS
jgi:glycosyltransferase involved in cell wall biosynthesis